MLLTTLQSMAHNVLMHIFTGSMGYTVASLLYTIPIALLCVFFLE